MDEENEEFNERFETIEEALKYIADSQAKSEWINKKAQVENRKAQIENEEHWNKIQRENQEHWHKIQRENEERWKNTQKHLDYITKLTGIAFEDIMFQDEKIQAAGETLLKKNPKRV
jgi:hypothetical protein